MSTNHTNGHNGNGKYHQSNLQDARLLLAEKPVPKQLKPDLKSYQLQQSSSVILRQSPIWSRAIMLTLMGLASFGVIWASIAKIEQVVPATGQLKPEAAVKEVQAPVGGVVKQVLVKDGQQVKVGDLLLVFDTEANKSELTALEKIRNSIIQENQIYRTLINSGDNPASLSLLSNNLNPEIANLFKNRSALLREIETLQTELNNNTDNNNLNNQEQQRLQAAQTELTSRTNAARLEIAQIKQQANQNQIKIQDARQNLILEQQILTKLENLAKEGAIAQLQYLKQKQTVQTLKSQISQLEQEQQRLKYDVDQGTEELTNTVASSQKNILEKIAANKQRIAEIDSQLSRILLENDKKLAEINSKIDQTKLNVKYQELRAPVAGTIFDLQAKTPGFVANPSEKILKIVPNDNLIAEIFITNRDIGFVQEGMKVDVRIESFPFSEFGDIKGEVKWIGSDALPPDPTHQFYRFPAKVRLNQQKLAVKGRDISLQSGMSISANIKVREERTVLSLFTEMFTNQIENLKQVR
ncbi:HlyD family efflux transporter periplasmic adaptor subunit [Calothrix sp. NIES-3974]|uniref:HlyD family efflux transporter periplasmic adaptor subunit n=1 Tax=Calothrix sp. NIES-3974 TaxID=2005462 RepID=UPI000B61E003|nr:HlyD family efflux transporter periplasmic adaptor subunit [Calothrix sp. NIES-3974]BAZ07481.1 HlyD family secretion protein [Calothrix sp. NIES-3974]